MPKRTCFDCKHVKSQHCTYSWEDAVMRIPQYPKIPDWCPLKDEPKQEWISVKDRLPMRMECVLIAKDMEAAMGYLDNYGWQLDTDSIAANCERCGTVNDFDILFEPTHWMPVPNVPTQGG